MYHAQARQKVYMSPLRIEASSIDTQSTTRVDQRRTPAASNLRSAGVANSSVARTVQELTLNSCSHGANSTTVCSALHSAHARHQGSLSSPDYSNDH